MARIKAMQSKHSQHIADFIIDVVSRHGTPSERGSEFCNQVNDALCKKLILNIAVPPTDIWPYRKIQPDSLKKYVNDQQDDWDCYLQQIAFAARSCHQKSINQTPFYLVYMVDRLLYQYNLIFQFNLSMKMGVQRKTN